MKGRSSLKAFLAIGCMAIIGGSGCDGERGSRANRFWVDSSSGRNRAPGAGFRSRCRPHDYLNPYVDWLSCDVVGRRLGRTLSAVFSLDDVASIRDGTAGIEVRESCADEPGVFQRCRRTLKSLPRLEILSAQDTWFRELDDDEFPRERVANPWPKLRVLGVVHSAIGDDDLRRLARIGSLEELYLDDNPITDGGIQQLGVLHRLRKLSLARTRVTATGIARLRRLLPKLEVDRSPGATCLPDIGCLRLMRK